VQSILQEKKFRKNTIDLQWKMRANYNATPCNGERKAAGARTMEKTMEKTMRRAMEASEIRARADASPGHIDTPQTQSPAAERRRAHTSKTRISAIAHSSAERTLKSAPVIPAGLSKKPYAIALPRTGSVAPVVADCRNTSRNLAPAPSRRAARFGRWRGRHAPARSAV
jgi:hypothetical protein